ncbi:Piezo-type mechanosensitive ion channel component 2, partial [Microtus ochrogaster]
HTGRLLQSLCLTSLSFLLLHIIFHITLASMEAQHRLAPAYNYGTLLGMNQQNGSHIANFSFKELNSNLKLIWIYISFPF